jgi:uncharacterized integral membrane protein
MPWRLIKTVALLAIPLIFIIFNLENKCDISFGFTVIKNVPVFLTAFVCILFGMFCALPFISRIKSRKKEKTEGPKHISGDNSGDSRSGHYGID